MHHDYAANSLRPGNYAQDYPKQSTPSTPGQPGEIDSQISRLMGAVERCGNNADVMRNRLSGVLRGVPEGGETKGAPEEVLCPTADTLRSIAKRIEHVEEQLGYMLAALAL